MATINFYNTTTNQWEEATVTNLDTHLLDYIRNPAFAVTTGTSTAYIATLTPAIPAYGDGFGITIIPHVECGVNPTLNVDGKGAVALYKDATTQYGAGEMKADLPYTFRYYNNKLVIAGGGSGTAVYG